MTAMTPRDGRWLTPPPMDGSDVWSGDGYAATNEPIGPYRTYTYADYAGDNGSADQAGYSGAAGQAGGAVHPSATGSDHTVARPAYVAAHAYRADPYETPTPTRSHGADYPYYAVAGAGPLDPSLPPYWPRPAGVREPVDGFAIASLVLGILGGLLAIPLGIVAPSPGSR